MLVSTISLSMLDAICRRSLRLPSASGSWSRLPGVCPSRLPNTQPLRRCGHSASLGPGARVLRIFYIQSTRGDALNRALSVQSALYILPGHYRTPRDYVNAVLLRMFDTSY
ncbi:hypothetical protein NDU88_002149 [Pleurodeles waltl]|uniref:Uncharacterized protein n=1 Tax=Pleurodeles waltl TaxID=8319 RepID=A0AAV7LBQ9_PLEWA|nr:hypothetical protein NDU88_002149 [Pleurodeles waltl]